MLLNYWNFLKKNFCQVWRKAYFDNLLLSINLWGCTQVSNSHFRNPSDFFKSWTRQNWILTVVASNVGFLLSSEIYWAHKFYLIKLCLDEKWWDNYVHTLDISDFLTALISIYLILQTSYYYSEKLYYFIILDPISSLHNVQIRSLAY